MRLLHFPPRHPVLPSERVPDVPDSTLVLEGDAAQQDGEKMEAEEPDASPQLEDQRSIKRARGPQRTVTRAHAKTSG